MEIKRLFCVKCEYQWYPRSPTKPKVCPRCKSFNWEEKRITIEND